MRKSIAFLFLGLLLAASACRKSFGDVSRDVVFTNVQLKAVYPSTFSKADAEDVVIKVRNNSTGQTVQVKTGADGTVQLSSLIRGSYQVIAERKVEPAEALALVGIEQEIFLNASITELLVTEHTPPQTLSLRGSLPGGIVFKELYYTGSRTPANGTYFSDQYFEIYNNSAQTIYLDSLCIANTGGASGQTATGRTWGFAQDNDYVYLQNVWMIPGDGDDHPLAPGQSFIIAQDGINHKTDPLGNANSPVNLGVGIGDFESFVPRADNRDLDAEVPNLEPVYLGSVGFDWLVPVFGPAMVMFRHPDPASLPLLTEPGTTSSARFMQVPVANVFDAVDMLANANAINFKRIPVALDAGFQFCSGTYVGEGVRRKVRTEINGRKVLQDFNNTSQDFEVIKPPTPKAW